MEIEEDDLEKRQQEVVEGLRDRIRKRLSKLTQYVLKYAANRKAIYRLLSSVLEKVAAGSLVVVLLPDEWGPRSVYGALVSVLAFCFAVKFEADSKE